MIDGDARAVTPRRYELGNLISQDNGNRNVNNTDAPKYLQRFFLKRLRRMVSIRREGGPLLDAGEFDIHLLDKAVYSTYCDCLDLDAGREARAILRHEIAGIDTSETEENLSN